MRRRDDPRVAADVERALAFARERELDGYVQYLLGVRANLRLLRAASGRRPRPTRAPSLELGEQLGRQPLPGADRARAAAGAPRRRRGGRDARARRGSGRSATQELQRLAPVAAARAEHAWLDGDLARAAAVAREAYELAAARRRRRLGARRARVLALARGRADRGAGGRGRAVRRARSPATGAAPRRRWERLGFPYERADALGDADDDDARLEALAAFDALGAARAASHLRRRLRAAACGGSRAGRAPASRAGPAGLTPRETEVLDLLVAGATNAEIAQALVIAPKTVDHHVSAVLGKLGVSSRREAGAAAEAACAPGSGLDPRPDREQVLHLEARVRRACRGSSSPQNASSAASNSPSRAVLAALARMRDRRAVARLEVLGVVARALERGDLEDLALERAPTRRGRRAARAGAPRCPTAAGAARRAAAAGRTGPSCGTARRSSPRASS